MNNKQLSEFISEFRNMYIGKEISMQEIKKILNDDYHTKINEIIENENIVNVDIEPINMMDHEMNICINKLDIIRKEGIIVYLVIEQETTSIMITSVKQKYYFDKENELFVSSVKMNEGMILNNLCYETMISYNGKFFYQERESMEEAAINLNNNIFNEIKNGRTIEEIKELYSNYEENEI